MHQQMNLLNDYNAVAHPSVIRALQAASDNYYTGYGADPETERAKQTIRDLIGSADADIHFMVGGTQTNLTAISAFLKPHEAVIAAESSHINMHETGAIEASGHKILTHRAADGKLDPDAVQSIVDAHTDEHMVKPRLVFISQATELGTVYGKKDLDGLRAICDANGLLLYVDGARLGCALTAEGSDFDLKDIAALADAFYIGGTKNGLLFGEALIISNPVLKPDFRYSIKQKGGLLAKGYLLGIQFNAIFRDGLYFELASHANRMSRELKKSIAALGYDFIADTTTNQLFPVMDNDAVDRLGKSYGFERWASVNNRQTAIRLVTSWSTSESDIRGFVELLGSG
jgi:threonine aldolase